MPRKLTLTAALHEKIVESVRAGNYLTTACEAAGVMRPTMTRWRDLGEAVYERHEQGEKIEGNDLLYLKFYEAIVQARAEAEQNRLKDLTAALQDDKKWQRWAGHMTILERSRPEHWKRRDVVEQKQQDPEEALTEKLDGMSRKERVAYLMELKAKLGDGAKLKVVA